MGLGIRGLSVAAQHEDAPQRGSHNQQTESCDSGATPKTAKPQPFLNPKPYCKTPTFALFTCRAWILQGIGELL